LFAATIAGVSILSFWDRDTTIAVHDKTAVLVCAATAAPVVFGLLRYWFKPREDWVRIPRWHLKHDSPGRWVLAGIGLALLLGLGFAWCGYYGVRIATQHLSGRRLEIAATLTAVEKVSGRRRACERRAWFFIPGHGDMKSCVTPQFGAPLMDEHVGIGDPVTLLIVENRLGTALVGVVARPTAQR